MIIGECMMLKELMLGRAKVISLVLIESCLMRIETRIRN